VYRAILASIRGRISTVQRLVAGPLTAREVEVTTLIAQGLSNRQIAEALVIAEATAVRHARIFSTNWTSIRAPRSRCGLCNTAWCQTLTRDAQLADDAPACPPGIHERCGPCGWAVGSLEAVCGHTRGTARWVARGRAKHGDLEARGCVPPRPPGSRLYRWPEHRGGLSFCQTTNRGAIRCA